MPKKIGFFRKLLARQGYVKVKEALINFPIVQKFAASIRQLIGSQDALHEYRGWPYACIRAISEEVGNIDLKLMRENKDGTEEVTDRNDLMDLLHRVNGTMTKANLFKSTSAYLDLTGNAFWYLARDKSKKIAEIWPLRPDYVELVKNELGLVIGYKLRTGNKGGADLPFTDVIHFKEFDPLDTSIGKGVIESARDSITMDNAARVYNRAFFENGAIPDYVFELDADSTMDEGEMEAFKEAWNSEYGTPGRAHKTGVLQGGMKLRELQRSQKEMDFIETRRFNRDEILAMFRVPRTVLGITDDVNRSNAETTNYVFALRAIKPRMQMIIDTLNEFLVPEYGDDLFLDFVSPVPDDLTTKGNYYVQGHNKWLSTNDIRRLEGLPPISNGDAIYQPAINFPVGSPEEKQVAKETKQRIRYNWRFSKGLKDRERKAEYDTKVEDTIKAISEEVTKQAIKDLEDEATTGTS